MHADLAIGDHASAHVSRSGVDIAPLGVKLDLSQLTPAAFAVGGHFIVECYDKDGALKWEDVAENMVTSAGIADFLNEYFRATTQTTAWYIGLVDNSGFVAFNAADTMASHAGWSEVAAGNYSNANRVTWSP